MKKYLYLTLLGVVMVVFLIKSAESSVKVRVGDIDIPVEIADEPQEHSKGLSGRTSLDANQGMLFVMPQEGKYGFWMKNMLFPIDIIWISGGKIVEINHNVQVDNSSSPKIYTPPQPVKYVLEVNSGFVAKHSINIGDSVEVNIKTP